MAEMIGGLNLVLLGNMGAGKSASGNTILGRQAFESKKSSRSVTQDVAVESGIVFGVPVTVYDTPGFCHTQLSVLEIQQILEKFFQKCESGRFVFLLVIKADRFTKEERETVEKIEKLLGEERMNETWILFTRGDELEEEKITIDEFINLSEPLKRLVQKYEQRYHVFNNKKQQYTGQVQDLLIKMDLKCLSSRRIVLLGKTGVGKSATGNTIVGQKVFRSEQSMCSVTRKCSKEHGVGSGRSVSVVDTPGFFETEMKPEDLAVEIARSAYIFSPGPHAFLIVFAVNMLFSEQEQEILQMIEMIFGQEVFKYSIILFTHGDQLYGQSVETMIQRNRRLSDLVDQCGGRFHVFNNKAQNNREQVNDLLQKIDSMIEQNGGGHYSNQMFEDAQRFRREEEEQRLRGRQIQEEIERVRRETEGRTRAEVEAELERRTAERQREEEQRKQREEKQKESCVCS